MIERLSPLLGSGDEDFEIVNQSVLTNKLLETLRPDGGFDGEILSLRRRLGQPIGQFGRDLSLLSSLIGGLIRHQSITTCCQ